VAEELLRSFTEALWDLNIARKNILIYPPSHEQVQRSTMRAHERLEQLLSRVGQVTVLAAEERLIVGGVPLDPKSTLLRELAAALSAVEIAALIFSHGLERGELLNFLRRLATDSRTKETDKGPEEAFRADEHRHIQIRFVDYSRLRFSEESAIDRRSADAGRSPLWSELVASMLERDDNLSEETSPTGIDPVHLAGMLNRHTIDPQCAVDIFDRFVSAGVASSEGDEARTSDGIAVLRRFNQLIQELTPDLRDRFTTVAFDRTNQSGDTAGFGWLIEGLGLEIALEMVRRAKADDKKISPSLLAFIEKVKQIPPSAAGQDRQPMVEKRFTSTSVRTLLSREAYEFYVDQEYDRLLKGMGAAANVDRLPPSEILAKELDFGMSTKEIDCHTGYALMRLMAVSGDIGGYRDWARQLALMLDDLARSRAFGCLCEILTFVRKEHEGQADLERKKITGLVFDRFMAPEFMAGLVAAAEMEKDETADDIGRLIAMLGEPAVVEILDSLHGHESAEVLEKKMLLLEAFGPLAAVQAQQRLNESHPPHAALMMRIIGRLGQGDTIEAVRPWLESSDVGVRLEALAVLVKHRNPWGLLRLRDLIKGNWSHTSERAMELAGRFKVKEMVPHLSAILERRGSIAADFPRREAAIRTLGRIGDPGGLAVLKKMAYRRWALSGKPLAQLKRTLYESLEGYPFNEVNDLIHFGLKHKDQGIQEICRRMLRKHHNPARPVSDA
jgi:hypothetical protein